MPDVQMRGKSRIERWCDLFLRKKTPMNAWCPMGCKNRIWRWCDSRISLFLRKKTLTNAWCAMGGKNRIGRRCDSQIGLFLRKKTSTNAWCPIGGKSRIGRRCDSRIGIFVEKKNPTNAWYAMCAAFYLVAAMPPTRPWWSRVESLLLSCGDASYAAMKKPSRTAFSSAMAKSPILVLQCGIGKPSTRPRRHLRFVHDEAKL